MDRHAALAMTVAWAAHLATHVYLQKFLVQLFSKSHFLFPWRKQSFDKHFRAANLLLQVAPRGQGFRRAGIARGQVYGREVGCAEDDIPEGEHAGIVAGVAAGGAQGVVQAVEAG